MKNNVLPRHVRTRLSCYGYALHVPDHGCGNGRAGWGHDHWHDDAHNGRHDRSGSSG